MLTIGIVGGIGPASSAKFYKDLVDAFQKSGIIKKNTDFPRIIINNIPAPELTSADSPDEVLREYRKGFEFFEPIKPDFIMMVCNTAHLFEEKIIPESLKKTFVSLRKLTGKFLKTHTSSEDKVGIIGTYLTVKNGLYRFPNINYIDLSDAELLHIGEIVKKYNSTGNIENARSELVKIVDKMKLAGVTKFILGCSEISVCLKGEAGLFADTLDFLIEDAINRLKLDQSK